MRRLLLIAVLAALPALAAPAAEAPVDPTPEARAAAYAPRVAAIIEGVEKLDFEDLWDRADELRLLGAEAGPAMSDALVKATPRARLITWPPVYEPNFD